MTPACDLAAGLRQIFQGGALRWAALRFGMMGVGAAVALLPVACAQHIDIEPTKIQGFAPWSDEVAPHLLAAGDDIELKFLLNPELNERLTVGPDGQVTVPLLGSVAAQGLTIAAFTKRLEAGYAPKLRVPEVDVIVRAYGSARIFVGGEVKTPGVLVMSGQMDVLQGVVAAGGALPTATLAKVVVIRRRPDHTPMLRTVDLRRIIGHADMAEDFPLQPADVIYVPRSAIAEVDLFVEQYLNQTLPFQKNVTANIGNGFIQ